MVNQINLLEVSIMNKEGIKVEGHIGTWYVIDKSIRLDEKNGKLYTHEYYLLESEQYGDEAACIAIRKDGSLLLEDIWNGVADIEEYLDDNPSMEVIEDQENTQKIKNVIKITQNYI